MMTQSRGHMGNGLFIFDCQFHGRISCLLHPMDRHMSRIEGHLAATSVLADMEKLRPPGLQCSGTSQGRFKSSCSAICDSSVFHRKRPLEAVSRAAESCLGRPPGVDMA
jgi:hypothetical protein